MLNIAGTVCWAMQRIETPRLQVAKALYCIYRAWWWTFRINSGSGRVVAGRFKHFLSGGSIPALCTASSLDLKPPQFTSLHLKGKANESLPQLLRALRLYAAILFTVSCPSSSTWCHLQPTVKHGTEPGALPGLSQHFPIACHRRWLPQGGPGALCSVHQ